MEALQKRGKALEASPHKTQTQIYVDVITGSNWVTSSKPDEIDVPVYSRPAERQPALCGAASEIYGVVLSGVLSWSQTIQGVKSHGPTAEGGEPAGSVM